MRRFRRQHAQTKYNQQPLIMSSLTAQSVASLPPPGLSGPSQPIFDSKGRYLAYVSGTTNTKNVKSPPALYRPLTTAPAASATTTSSTATTATYSSERILLYVDLHDPIAQPKPLLKVDTTTTSYYHKRPHTSTASSSTTDDTESLEERLRRERQRLSGGGASLTQFHWVRHGDDDSLRILIPVRGSLYVQTLHSAAKLLHDKSIHHAIDAQLSPDGKFVAWTACGELWVQAVNEDGVVEPSSTTSVGGPIQLTYGAIQTDDACISHGIADFVAQEEMDRYRGYWWHPESTGILLARVDESKVPVYRIAHFVEGEATPTSSSSSSPSSYEDHRYPFAGKDNPAVKLAFVKIDRESLLRPQNAMDEQTYSAEDLAVKNWNEAIWFDPPREAPEYLARVYWLQDGSAIAQWQNRAQNVSVLHRLDLESKKGRMLLVDRSDVWINLHHMFKELPRAIHPDECTVKDANVVPMPNPLPRGSFSFLFASERSGFSHLYLYTYAPGINGEQAVLLRAVTSGDWMVEHIAGVNMNKDTVYFTGTFDSCLERHLYALPIVHVPVDKEESGHEDSPTGMRRGLSKVMSAFSGGKGGRRSQSGENQLKPLRLTIESGMHSIIMDENCRFFVDTSSDLDRPTTSKVYELSPENTDKNGSRQETLRLVTTLFDAARDDKSLLALTTPGTNGTSSICYSGLDAPEIINFPTSDGAETLYAALYRPDPRIHGPGPYPLVCAVYGGPHVQRVNRSWAQCADMRVQRLRNLGFCVVKCDNRGSSRRGIAFESAISRRLGRLEVLDQVSAVRHLVARGLADPTRVGVYGWSYGGYLALMCLCRAPDVFHVGVAGAPVTSWDGYDTHYTERYMGLPADNPAGYRESAVFDHVPNMRGKLMLVHGLIDENVHFRHTARLINKLTAAGKEYELMVFPDERHSPRRLRDRVYMEQRISDFFCRNLSSSAASTVDLVDTIGQGGLQGLRAMAGRL